MNRVCTHSEDNHTLYMQEYPNHIRLVTACSDIAFEFLMEMNYDCARYDKTIFKDDSEWFLEVMRKMYEK